MDENLEVGDLDQKKEVEDLKSKLEAATEICTKQEKHFSYLVKDLGKKLNEAVTGRDELLTLRQQESLTQQQLIFQLQTTLRQTQQTLELRSQTLSDFQSRAKHSEEHLNKALTILMKIHGILKNEDIKRRGTSTLTETTSGSNLLHCEDVLTQLLADFLNEDDAKISDLMLKSDECEKQLQKIKDVSESDKVRLIREYENKLITLEADHAKSLDIAANRTLAERNRVAELTRNIDENKLRYEKTISDHERMIHVLEETLQSCREDLSERRKEHETQHSKDVAICEEMQRKLKRLEAEKEELLNSVLENHTSEKSYEEKIFLHEGQDKDSILGLKSTKKKYEDCGSDALRFKSQSEEALEVNEERTKRIDKESEKEPRLTSGQILSLENEHGSIESWFKNYDNEAVSLVSMLREELEQKTDEVLKFMEECRTLRNRVDKMENEKSVVVVEKDELKRECENLNKKILTLHEEKSNLSNMVRGNVEDLNQAKNVINSLQVRLNENEKRLEAYNKQEADLAALMFEKHLAGESLLQERQQIVQFLEEKVRENDELKGIRDALVEKLELKIQGLNEMEATCRALETKLDVRSHELEVIMDDRNKAVREMESKVVELTKMKEENDSLVTLLNGKENEKDKEISKLLSSLKKTQHDLALTKKVFEAKKEANETAIRMASSAQEEITAKRKEADSLQDRIKWLQDSLQATAEEKVRLENKALDLASKLRDKNEENENIIAELHQMMNHYDKANGQVNQMEMALEKAGIKFAESQTVVERLEQDLAKIKLLHSLEVKELEMKVKSVEAKGQHVQVVKPFRVQNGGARVSRHPEKAGIATMNQLNATKQRLTDESEMTEGFKTLLKDLREVMCNIRDSSIMLRTQRNVKETGTAEDVIQDKKESRKAKTTSASSSSRNSKIITDSDTISTVTSSSDNSSRKSSGNPTKDRRRTKRTRSPKNSGASAPLYSSSPKRTSLAFDSDVDGENTTGFGSFDISNVQSACSKTGDVEMSNFVTKSLKSPKLRNSKMKEQFNLSIEPEDVDSLLMPEELPARSHRRAKKILDLLTLKSQELTNGNQKIAELIGRQDDGIKRCREVERSIKRILK